MPNLIILLAFLLLGAEPSTLESRLNTENMHDFHVSRTNINYNSETQKLEITLLTFIDDLEAAVTQQYALDQEESTTPAADLNFFAEDEHANADSLIAQYTQDVFKILVDNDNLSLKYLGKQQDDDPYGCFLFIESGKIEDFKTLGLQSSWMISLFDDQQNVVIWQKDRENKKYELLTEAKRTSIFSL